MIVFAYCGGAAQKWANVDRRWRLVLEQRSESESTRATQTLRTAMRAYAADAGNAATAARAAPHVAALASAERFKFAGIFRFVFAFVRDNWEALWTPEAVSAEDADLVAMV